MATTLKTMLDRLPAERRRRVEARAEALIGEEMTLRDLRKARDLTQERLAAVLGIGQDSVSRLEQRSDLLLSTLRGYVGAMGGTLELVARFPDRPAVVLTGLSDLAREADLPGERAAAVDVVEPATIRGDAGDIRMPNLARLPRADTKPKRGPARRKAGKVSG
jgi:transcriptional regulator with XRE-family HTH domain